MVKYELPLFVACFLDCFLDSCFLHTQKLIFDLVEFFNLLLSRGLCVNLCSLIWICLIYLFIDEPYDLERWAYPQISSCLIRCIQIQKHLMSLFYLEGWRAIIVQGRTEGMSSVTFEVLMMNCKIDSINLFIFKYLALNISLFILNCLTSNFYFPKNIYFASRREPLFMDARVCSSGF